MKKPLAIICVDSYGLTLEAYEGWLKSKFRGVKVMLGNNFKDSVQNVAEAVKENRRVVLLTAMKFLAEDGQLSPQGGLALIRRVHAKYPEVSCIVVSGSVDRVARDEFIQMNVLFCDKNMDYPAILAAIKDAVETGKGSGRYAAERAPSVNGTGPKHD